MTAYRDGFILATCMRCRTKNYIEPGESCAYCSHCEDETPHEDSRVMDQKPKSDWRNE